MPGATLDPRDLAVEKMVPGPLGTTGALSTASYVFVWHAVGRLLGQLLSCLRRQSPDCFSSGWEVFSSSVSWKWHRRGALSEDFRASCFFSFLRVCGFSGSSAPGIPPFSVEPLDVLQWSISQGHHPSPAGSPCFCWRPVGVSLQSVCCGSVACLTGCPFQSWMFLPI